MHSLVVWFLQFFTTEPYPCEPSSLPKFPPSKEMDIKLRDEEARRCFHLPPLLLVADVHQNLTLSCIPLAGAGNKALLQDLKSQMAIDGLEHAKGSALQFRHLKQMQNFKLT